MTQAAGLAIRWLHFLSGVLLVGSLLHAALAFPFGRDEREGRLAAALPWALAAAVLGLLSAAALLVCQAAAAAELGPFDLQWDGIRRFAFGTHVGRVWVWRQALGVALLAVLVVCRLGRRLIGSAAGPAIVLLLLGALAYQASPALSGHGAGSDEAGAAIGGHALHLAASSLWLGGLLVLTLSLLRGGRRRGYSGGEFGARLRAFSPLATWCMGALVVSGIWLGWVQVALWPALFGTRYGLVLIAKLGCLAVVLAAAAHLRWRQMARIEAALDSTRGRVRVVSVFLLEAAAALAVSFLASNLGAMLPARHEAIDWPLPLRIAPTAAWAGPDAAGRAVGAALLLCVGAAFWWLARRRRAASRRSPTVARVAAAVCVVAALCTAAWALSVPAFPDTYRRSVVPYQAVSVAGGQALFRQHCVACHGADATGHGPQAAGMARPPADLTAPHAADHTAGDMYWWLTQGIPAGGMPAFGQLSDEQRWDLVNYLHTLSRGYQARVLRERIVAERPWLGAPDFDYVDSGGTAGSLRDYRDRGPVLLVLYDSCGSAGRLRQIGQLGGELSRRGVAVLAIPGKRAAECPATPPLATVVEGNEVIATTYALFRHTFESLRQGDADPQPTHMEFLVDRFGYLRARWLPEDVKPGWADSGFFFDQLDALAREPKVLTPPGEHLH